MSLGVQIFTLRKQKKMSQNDLGKQIGTSGDIIGRYERDEVKPSIEVAFRIADVLEVSLDYLVGKTDVELDTATVSRINEISKLTAKEKEHVYELLDAFIAKSKIKNLMGAR